jgi:hypothetical protein
MTMADNKKLTIADLKPLICDADNMADVLLTLLERHFAVAPEANFVLVEGEGRRLLFIAGVLNQMLGAAKKGYLDAAFSE